MSEQEREIERAIIKSFGIDSPKRGVLPRLRDEPQALAALPARAASGHRDLGGHAMSAPRIGSLFSGYGGLDMGVTAALGGSVAWHVEYDKAPSKILAHHWPDVPNYGDVTAVDWSQVEPVDVITGGSPCQDLSHAGRRKGMTEGTRSNLWVAMREAIAQLRPGMVIWENVRGAYSAAADSELESNPRLLADTRRRDGEPVLRALGRVLGDLSDLGYDCRWHGLRAADVGAPHGRFRVFVVAYPADPQGVRLVPRELPLGDAKERPILGGDLLPTPVARDFKGAGPADMDRHSPNLSAISALLPTPAVNDMGRAAPCGDRKPHGAHWWGVGLHCPGVVLTLLPTPEASRAGGTPERHLERKRLADGSTRTLCTNLDVLAAGTSTDWGIYADSIAHWESLTRPAPSPTQPSKKGTPQLSPAFSEWMMGLPEGHVTDVPGLSRNDMLKALGNGVVPQQAEAALRFLLGVRSAAA